MRETFLLLAAVVRDMGKVRCDVLSEFTLSRAKSVGQELS
jgi:hypothetical protein